ncbi:MAG: hypothetical protein HGB03_04130 [Candidatus Yonathbacteria bacterium]|nr:hypothetical protein [Candidatus Yonathbacteria bacterium]NTW47583.1 hypothetical protein [Candidatus Yonathbacteria bacterium]
MLSFYKGIENDIIKRLANGPLSAKALVKEIARERKVTDQGVYKALKYLVDEEVITKQKRSVGLSHAWVERLSEFADDVVQAYEVSEMNDFLHLEDGGKVSYTFTEYIKADVHWAHIFFMLAKRTDAPIFFLSPHDWFIVARPDTESVLYSWAERAQRHIYTMMKRNTPLDKATEKLLSGDFVHLYCDSDVNAPMNHFTTSIGDFIFDFIIPEHVADEMEELYRAHTEINEETTIAFRALTNKKWPVRFTVEHNAKKSLKFRRRLAKDFFIPADVREGWL